MARLVLVSGGLPFLTKTADDPDGVDPAALEAGLDLWRKDYPAWLHAGIEAFYRPEVFGISKGIIDWTLDMMFGIPIQVLLPCGKVFLGTDLRQEKRDMPHPHSV